MSPSGNDEGQMGSRDERPAEIAAVVEDYLIDKGKGPEGKSGTYRRDAKREINRLLTFLEDERPRSPTTFHDLTIRDLRQYARHLNTQDWAESTIQNYYAHISAFCGWAVREGYLEENPALKSRAKEPLPEDDGRKTDRQQAWSPEQRTALLKHVDEKAHDAIDDVGENRYEAIKACRDRALVYLLCFSGVRGAEVLADVADTRRGRDGLRWSDVSLQDNTITVLGKKGEWSDRAVPPSAIPSLERLGTVLDPPSDDWPLFTTLSYPSLVETFKDNLAERDYTREEAENIHRKRVNNGDVSMIELCVEYKVEPPALTTHSARRILKRLTEEAAIDLQNDKHGYLAPHGARRGAGEVMVREFGYAEAARHLDNSEEVVREHYSHIEASERAQMAETAFQNQQPDRNDGSGQDRSE
jgi:site-specific recombinase XerD